MNDSNSNNKEKEKGFIYAIALIVISLVALKVFWGFDIVTFFEKPAVKDFMNSFLEILKSFWGFVKDKIPLLFPE